MSFTVGGSTPQLTFADATVQNTAFTGLNQSATPFATSLGYQALNSNTGANNTAVGYQAGYSNTAAYNTFTGWKSAYTNTTGSFLAAFGEEALYGNTTGAYNTAMGSQALASNTTASNNTAVGYQAGYTNQTGGVNVFIGYQAGYTSNAVGTGVNLGYNTCVGPYAGYGLTTGVANCFIGSSIVSGPSAYGSGQYVTTGSYNTILGGYNGNQGGLDIRTLNNYIVLSDGAGNPRGYFRGSDGIFSCLGSYTVTTSNAANVNIDASGFMLRSTSALKYKQNIRDLEEVDINKFRAVRYNSKCENDDQTLDHFGVIADEVDKAGIKELVSYGADGEVEGFQYERLTVVLLKKLQVLESEFKAYKEAHP